MHGLDMRQPYSDFGEYVDKLITKSAWEEIAKEFALSFREREVARFLFHDLTREQIASRLKKADGNPISPETVRVYIDRLFKTLNVTSTVQAVLKIVCAVHRI